MMLDIYQNARIVKTGTDLDGRPVRILARDSRKYIAEFHSGFDEGNAAIELNHEFFEAL